MSYGEILREVGRSTKDMIQSEVNLVGTELKQITKDLGSHLGQVDIFGALLGLSVLPFLAFAVIGLGELLQGRYWLSSLIVAVVCAVVGGGMAYRAYRKIVSFDLNFSRVKDTVARDANRIEATIEQVTDAVKGAHNEDILH